MKKVLSLVISMVLALFCFAGCNDSDTHNVSSGLNMSNMSKASNDPVKNKFVPCDYETIESYNNMVASDSASISFCFAKVNDDSKVYITNNVNGDWAEYATVLYNGKTKEKTMPFAFNIYTENQAIYYTYWEGTTRDPVSLMKEENGVVECINSDVNNNSDTVYRTKYNNEELDLSKINYNGESLYFIGEFMGYMWFGSIHSNPQKILRYDMDTKELDIVCEGSNSICLLKSQGFLYNTKDAIWEYNAETESINKVSDKSLELKHLNQCKGYYFFTNTETRFLYRADQSFENIEAVMTDGEIAGINVSKDRLFVRYYDNSNNSLYCICEIDIDGNVIQQFD